MKKGSNAAGLFRVLWEFKLYVFEVPWLFGLDGSTYWRDPLTPLTRLGAGLGSCWLQSWLRFVKRSPFPSHISSFCFVTIANLFLTCIISALSFSCLSICPLNSIISFDGPCTIVIAEANVWPSFSVRQVLVNLEFDNRGFFLFYLALRTCTPMLILSLWTIWAFRRHLADMRFKYSFTGFLRLFLIQNDVQSTFPTQWHVIFLWATSRQVIVLKAGNESSWERIVLPDVAPQEANVQFLRYGSRIEGFF